MATTTAQFFEQLAEIGLLSPDELENLQEQTGPEWMDRDSTIIARRLVQQKKLTDYQAARLAQGDLAHLVFGDYLALDQIGRGGMASVFKAQHRDTGRLVAIKVLEQTDSMDKEAAYRFDREVMAAAKLSHANIVTAYDSVHRDDINYLVMEYVDGPTLAQYVAKRGPLPMEEACNYIYQAALGLQHAHEKRLVHRDIKPENLLIDSTGTVKILDMGLVRFDNAPRIDRRPDELERLTQMGTMLGTADFMSPEQSVDPRSADYRSDIYSLGCTLYYLLTGKAPFSRDTTMATLMAHQSDPIPSLLVDRPDLPQELQQVFETMVAKDPYDRYQEVSEVLQDLQLFLAEEDLAALQGEYSMSVSASTNGSLAARPRSAVVRKPAESKPAAKPQRSVTPWGFITGGLTGAIFGATAVLVPSPVNETVNRLVEGLGGPLAANPLVAMVVYGCTLGCIFGFLIGELLPRRAS